MTSRNLGFLCILLFFLSLKLAAAPTVIWQCYVSDGNKLQWMGIGQYQKSAVGHAMEACKKTSSVPESCKVVNEDCDNNIDGQSSRPMWQCVALDFTAQRWPSRLYYERDRAALAARNFCLKNSEVPATCYLNFVTCINKNAP